MSSELIDQARADLDAGQTDRARVALAEHVADHYDVDALDLLGEILHGEGDLAGAGAMWFATKRRGGDVVEAQNAWREHYHDDFGALWASLPPSVREDSPLPRVDALRRKAIETGGMPPADPASVIPPRAAEASDADDPAAAQSSPAPALAPVPEQQDDATEDEPVTQPQVQRVVLRPVDLDGDGDVRASTDVVSSTSRTEHTDEIHLAPADGDPGVDEQEVAEETSARPAPELKSGRPARALPKLTPGTISAKTGSLSTKIGARSGGGVDSATIIAGVLAVLAVICMIVGLITILGWIIPG